MTHEFVPPEPLTPGSPQKGWEHVPRWLRIALVIVVIAVGIFILLR